MVSERPRTDSRHRHVGKEGERFREACECPYCKQNWLFDDEDADTANASAVQCRNCGPLFSVASASCASCQPSGLPESATVVSNQTRLPEGKTVALVVMKGPEKGEVFYLQKPLVEIGRSGTDIQIHDPEVSSRHCQLEIRGEVGHLVDLGSTNGIVVEGSPVKSCLLSHLAEFRIGSTTLMFTVSTAESAS